MFINPATMMEKFNPGVSIKNIAAHNCLIIMVILTIDWTAIVTMFHHLIILFTFCIRPTACQTEEICFTFFCYQIQNGMIWHYQLIRQPFSLTLGEGKPLQIIPKIVQCKFSHNSIGCLNCKDNQFFNHCNIKLNVL